MQERRNRNELAASLPDFMHSSAAPLPRRRRSCDGLSLPLAALFVVSLAAAQDAPIRVTIAPPPELHAGDHAELIVEVALAEDARGPVLVTPSADGAAIEIVRGRLFRFEAEDPDADPLRFHVPIVARTAGTAIVSIHVAGHRCDGPRCDAVEADASRTIDVR